MIRSISVFLAAASALVASRLAADDLEAPARFLRGDANGDGILSQADAIALIRFFQVDRLPPCADAADFDDSGALDITDLVAMVAFFYLDGDYPAPPFRELGEDPTPDELDCESQPISTVRFALQDGFDGDQDDGQVIDFIEFYNRRLTGFPGQMEIKVPMLISTTSESDGFTICVWADPKKVWLERIDLPSFYPGRLRPELSPQYLDLLTEGYLARSVFMDYRQPFEGNKLPRSKGMVAAHLVFGLSQEVKENEKVSIRFADIPFRGDPRPLPFNEIVNEGRSIRPTLDPNVLEITIAPEHSLFIRGDSNRDSSLNITDVVIVLRYLFIGEVARCLDPLDIDDSGMIDISDAISLAEFLFGRGYPPAAPFPNPGKDTTDDVLENCR